MQITIFYIPFGDKDTAQKLGKLALEMELAGCVNIFPIQSIFPWEGAMQEESEFVLILKTATNLEDKLSSFIRENHPYEIPCIINWKVEVNQAYGEWIERNVATKSR